MKKIQIIVGTMTGTAEGVAEACMAKLLSLGHEARILMDAEQGDLLCDPSEATLIVTANTGQGDIPINLIPLFIELTSHQPNIAGKQYGLINLADSSYPTFGKAGDDMDQAMRHLNATKVGETLTFDACLAPDYDSEAADWVSNWVEQLQ